MPSTDHKYQALLAVSEAIVSHRELSALFHELAGRLHQVVRFDYLVLYLKHILGALRETGWVVAGPKGAAARLGVKRSTLKEKRGKPGISPPPARGHAG